jgi:adenine-specific DNA methylase
VTASPPEPGGAPPATPDTAPEPARIVRKVEVSRASLRKNNPATSGHSAVVYVTKRGEYQVGSGRLTMGELWLATPREMYLVDTTPRDEVYEMRLPSLEEAFFYAASVRVTWRVADPVAAVRAGAVEPRDSIGRFLEEPLREVTRQFGVERSADAERRIAHDFGNRVMRISDAVEVTRCTAVLELDEDTRKHIASRTQFARSSETELKTQELRRMRAEHARELQQLKERHELDMKQQRMRVYADALRADDVNVLALRLSGHDEDVKDVINLLMEQKKLGLDKASAVLDMLLENNLVNHKDVAHLLADSTDTLLGLPQKSGPPVPAKSTRVDLSDDDEDDDDGADR